MANTVIALKKSATPSATPASLANGELAINYADGKLFYKAANGAIVEFSQGGASYGTVNANGTLIVAASSGDVFSLVPGNNITIVGDAINDRVTIGLKNSPTFIGDTTVSGGGKFIAGAVGGDEGGEILLEKPPNGTLDGGITIDAYQNKLRIFEQGGSARGVFIDLTAAGAGVSTNLLSSSGGTDSTARAAASAAFDKANSANSLAYNTGIGANAFASATIAGANAAVGAGANSYAATVGTSANAYLLTVIAGANSAVGAGANTVGSAAFNKANSAETIAIAAYANSNTKLSTSGGTITGDLSVVGNLTISGNTSYVSVQNYRVDDPLIYLAANNYTSDIVDIGFIANYVNATSSNVHTGLLRNHEDKEYYLFYGYDQEPVNNHVDVNGNNFTIAVLNADIKTSNLVLGGQNTITWIRSAYDQANAAYAQANVGGGGGAAVNVSETGPTSPSIGNLWWNSNTGKLLIYYSDADSSQWVETSGGSSLVGSGSSNTVSLSDRANAAYEQANAAYNQANLVFSQANAAYSQANTAYSQANLVFDQANAAYNAANAAASRATAFSTIF